MPSIEAINELIKELKENQLISTKDVSDRYHTFGELYTHRIILFAIICNTYCDFAWKSKQHFDPEDPMFDDSFVAGVKTPMGDATYHIKLKYWELFNVEELERAPKWDGHNADDTLIRLLSLDNEQTLSSPRKRTL